MGDGTHSAMEKDTHSAMGDGTHSAMGRHPLFDGETPTLQWGTGTHSSCTLAGLWCFLGFWDAETGLKDEAAVQDRGNA
jgi:hypothetical protein